jgi:hypothetical protein
VPDQADLAGVVWERKSRSFVVLTVQARLALPQDDNSCIMMLSRSAETLRFTETQAGQEG